MNTAQDVKQPRRNKTLNKWRHVRYADDGVDEYQCLKCKHHFGLRYGLGPFCPGCGTRWDSQHVWDEEAWQTARNRRWQRRDDGTRLWLIEFRYTTEPWRQMSLDIGEEWSMCGTYGISLYPAARIKEFLVRERQLDTEGEREFRVRVIDLAQAPSFR